MMMYVAVSSHTRCTWIEDSILWWTNKSQCPCNDYAPIIFLGVKNQDTIFFVLFSEWQLCVRVVICYNNILTDYIKNMRSLHSLRRGGYKRIKTLLDVPPIEQNHYIPFIKSSQLRRSISQSQQIKMMMMMMMIKAYEESCLIICETSYEYFYNVCRSWLTNHEGFTRRTDSC